MGHRYRRTLPFVALILLCANCARRPLVDGSFGPGPGQTGFHSEGTTLFLAVDVRAARLTGPGEFLPAYVVVANKDKSALHLDRESFTLETPSGSVLPLATYEEFRRDYQRSLADERMAQSFLDAVAGKFPESPYHWMELDFFPPKDATTGFPRKDLDLRLAEVARGQLYFRSPEGRPFSAGTYKLLMRPRGSDATYVVDFKPFEAP